MLFMNILNRHNDKADIHTIGIIIICNIQKQIKLILSQTKEGYSNIPAIQRNLLHEF
jgi:hypothetical protein